MQNNPYPDLIATWRDPRRELRSTVRVLAIVAAVVLCFTILFTQIFIGVQVVGSSMEPTLYGGDYLFVDTTAGIRRGDIVVVETDMHGGAGETSSYEWIIKRVLGLPGDTLYAQGGVLYRRQAGEAEFSVVEEPYLDAEEPWTVRSSFPEITVPEGQVYLLGDHRNVSEDSRSIGPQPIVRVVGVVTGWSLAAKDFFTGIFGQFARNP